MVHATFGKLLFGAAFLLSSCVTVSGITKTAPPQYPEHAKSTRTSVTVTVVWMDNFRAVNAVCTYLMQAPQRAIVGCFDPSTNTIYAVEPASFNDATRLEILGHEFWHALGAVHPEN